MSPPTVILSPPRSRPHGEWRIRRVDSRVCICGAVASVAPERLQSPLGDHEVQASKRRSAIAQNGTVQGLRAAVQRQHGHEKLMQTLFATGVRRAAALPSRNENMRWANCLHCLRAAIKPALVGLALLGALLVAHQCLLPAIAFVFPSLDPVIFDLGLFGAYPLTHYASFNLAAPQPRQILWHDKCDAGNILLTPNGPAVTRPGPMILDSKGGLVWTSDDFGATANLKVQRFQGEHFLTLWSGQKAATSGKGVYFMLDSTYQVVRMISAVGDALFGDLHEFKITPEGTALLTVYNATNADLRDMGMGRPEKGWVVDNLFQEIDIETGELLFEWSALDHFDPVETHMTNPFGGYWESIPFDFYHLNSVDKDSQGNYIISSRHFHHILSVSPTGEILWILGGDENQFHDLSDGQATNFKWQHDVRWINEDEGVLTLFDNSKAGPLHIDATESRALVIQIDVENKTARLLQSMTSAQGILSSSQGSVQYLGEFEQFFVGWGSAAAYSEYTPHGDLLCETHLGASWYFWLEKMKSYRTTKVFNWHGMPREPPKTKIEDDVLYVSWNGATEVAFWALEATFDMEEVKPEDLRSKDENSSIAETKTQETDFESIDVVPKTGFEASFDLSQSSSDRPFTKLRVAALNSAHEVLRYSEPCDPQDHSTSSSYFMIVFKLFLVVGFLGGARLALKHFRSSGQIRSPGAASTQFWPDWRDPSSYGYRRARSDSTTSDHSGQTFVQRQELQTR
ncbi:uncharacterized protein MYCFIDRAFT_213318 [Pseudocercospora fijiensis CIRAD86]|uniref:ASST-domain-containing protein n=1 Tax=Pseudocercospora fijiensis (strain CIRAD86) TaxID=383855 RepID=N1Q7A5_PSEFD|nr:uncharacterized protein MYCFIDRAFT_213318 [Pseudocercospora fijiensis CIRAD86]EME88514.1 hypothetical protein MYCFIDRAFT_213318 [Pseudocercospora fijiensis CIRAD86]